MNSIMIWEANDGIGRALTAELTSNDWNVIAVTRDSDEVAKALVTIQADVVNPYPVQEAALSASHEVDAVDL